MPCASATQFRRDVVMILVFRGQSLRVGVGRRVDRIREFADAKAVGRRSRTSFPPPPCRLPSPRPGACCRRSGRTSLPANRAMRARPASTRRSGHEPPGSDQWPTTTLRVRRMREWMKPASRSPWADWFRFMKSMSIDAPRQIPIELRMEMQERLLERVEAADPHLRGRKRVHPENEAGAVFVRIRLHAEPGDLVGRGQKRLGHGLQRQRWRIRESARDVPRVGGHPLQRSRAVKMLRAADEPDFGSSQIDHERPASVSVSLDPFGRAKPVG